MTLKWKIFSILNYFQILVLSVPFLSMIIETIRHYDKRNLGITFISFLSMLLIILNSWINLAKQHSFFYGERPVGFSSRKIFVLNIILYCLALGFLCIATAALIVIMTNPYFRFPAPDTLGFYSYLSFHLAPPLGIYILIYQVKLQKLIRKTHQQEYEDFLSAGM